MSPLPGHLAVAIVGSAFLVLVVALGRRRIVLRMQETKSALRQGQFYWDIANASRMGDYLAQVEGDFIQTSLPMESPDGVVIDVGVGSGRFAVPLHHAGYRVIGVDVDPVALHNVREKAPDIDVILIDKQVSQFPLTDASVDCVLCIEVFTLVNETWFWSECQRILRDGGIVIVTTHNHASYKAWLRRLVSREHASFGYAATFKEIRAQLRQSGFETRRERGFCWAPANRLSNSRLVSVSAFVERVLRLDHLVQLSPWVIFLAEKRGSGGLPMA